MPFAHGCNRERDEYILQMALSKRTTLGGVSVVLNVALGVALWWYPDASSEAPLTKITPMETMAGMPIDIAARRSHRSNDRDDFYSEMAKRLGFRNKEGLETLVSEVFHRPWTRWVLDGQNQITESAAALYALTPGEIAVIYPEIRRHLEERRDVVRSTLKSSEPLGDEVVSVTYTPWHCLENHTEPLRRQMVETLGTLRGERFYQALMKNHFHSRYVPSEIDKVRMALSRDASGYLKFSMVSVDSQEEPDLQTEFLIDSPNAFTMAQGRSEGWLDLSLARLAIEEQYGALYLK